MTSADQFTTRVDAVAEQHSRLFGADSNDAPWTPSLARLFRFDPHRNLEPNLQMISQYVHGGDVFVDVGGGAGRVSLPLALRCREAIAVDPSPAMGAEFDDSRREAGIANARRIQADWMDARDVTGDVVFSADVTYFVRDIVPFVEKLVAAARRRVMITLWSVSPPNDEANLFELLYGEPMAPVPGFRELLAVLWDLDILPDVLALPEPPWWEGDPIPTREEAMRNALESVWVREDDIPRAEQVIASHFEQLFSDEAGGFRPRWRQPSRELLITWATK
ncbi:MAG: class I SAM-dependent methyltransferase [Chloroflexi bacterium]|nr:class I SAM-dependent methyltransferase [Chloroflexota bacterium]